MDLDYDDNLSDESKELELPDVPPVEVETTDTTDTLDVAETLAGVVALAQGVFGLTNSSHAQFFYEWAVVFLKEGALPPRELLVQLRQEANYWGPRACMTAKQGREVLASLLRKRWNAVRCAIMCLHAVQAEGVRRYGWITRCYHYADLAFGDERSASYGQGTGSGKFATLG